jgi:hypothetical protein
MDKAVNLTCQCDLWLLPCSNKISQEDLRCDVCRDACILLVIQQTLGG